MTKIVAVGLCPEQTIITKIMTRNPVFVMADTLASEALQMMVQGWIFIFRIQCSVWFPPSSNSCGSIGMILASTKGVILQKIQHNL